MRGRYFISFAVILAWQAAMAASIFFCPEHWLRAIEVSGFLLPFLGYFFSFYRAPVFTDWSRIMRPIALTLSFAAVTVVGFFFFTFFMFFLFMTFGGHHW